MLLLAGLSITGLAILGFIVVRVTRPMGERRVVRTTGDQLLSLDRRSRAEALSALTRRQRRVLTLRLRLERDAPLSREEVARALGMALNEVIAAEKRAWEKIERHLLSG